LLHACLPDRQANPLKLAAAGEHLSIVRVAIYVAYLQLMYSAMQHKESIPEHIFIWLIVFDTTN
jgi:hypothetical protein